MKSQIHDFSDLLHVSNSRITRPDYDIFGSLFIYAENDIPRIHIKSLNTFLRLFADAEQPGIYRKIIEDIISVVNIVYKNFISITVFILFSFCWEIYFRFFEIFFLISSISNVLLFSKNDFSRNPIYNVFFFKMYFCLILKHNLKPILIKK